MRGGARQAPRESASEGSVPWSGTLGGQAAARSDWKRYAVHRSMEWESVEAIH